MLGASNLLNASVIREKPRTAAACAIISSRPLASGWF